MGRSGICLAEVFDLKPTSRLPTSDWANRTTDEGALRWRLLSFRPKWRNLLLFGSRPSLCSRIVRDASTALDMTKPRHICPAFHLYERLALCRTCQERRRRGMFIKKRGTKPLVL